MLDEKLTHLCQAVRTLGPGFEIRIRASEIFNDQWSIQIQAGSAIVAFTEFLPLERALEEAIAKMAGISSRMMKAVRETPE